jgi:hypothetical protein
MKQKRIDLPRSTQRRASRANIPFEVLQELTKVITEKVVGTTIDQYTVIIAYTLWKKARYGNKKLIMTLNQIKEMSGTVETCEMTISQMNEEMETELGIKLVEKESTEDANDRK